MLPSFALTQIMIFILLLTWLGACVVCDLRSNQVPSWLTILPLMMAALWRLFQSGWQMAALVIVLILISDLPWSKWRIPLACMGSVLAMGFSGTSANISSLSAIFAIWLAWETGATGGADAKIIITLVLWFANGLVFIPIVLIGGIQGLLSLISRGKTIPYTVAITLGTAAWLWLSAGR